MDRSKTRQELANEYGVSRRTFYCWLKQADITFPPGLLMPRHIEKIYDHFGIPERFSKNKNDNFNN